MTVVDDWLARSRKRIEIEGPMHLPAGNTFRHSLQALEACLPGRVVAAP